MEYYRGIMDMGYVYDRCEVITDLDARRGNRNDIIIGLDRAFHEDEDTPVPEYRMDLEQVKRMHYILGRFIEDIEESECKAGCGWYLDTEYVAMNDCELLEYLHRIYKSKWTGLLANFIESEGFSLQPTLDIAMRGDSDIAQRKMEWTLLDGIEYHREEEGCFRFNKVEYTWREE